MTTDITWLSAHDTLAHVLAHELSPDAAQTKLEYALWRGLIPARAALLMYLGAEFSDAAIPSDFWNRQWRHVWIDFTNSTARSRAFGPAAKGGYVDYISDDNATGVAFSQRHLYLIWPEIASAANGLMISQNEQQQTQHKEPPK
jgi:hypothetical protein